MAEIFLKIVNMSISAGWIVLAVILVRLLLKKAPKWIAVLLWGLVAVRLLCPFSIESILSLMPSGETISPEIMMEKEPQIDSGVPIVNTIVNPYISESFAPTPGDSANPLQIVIPILATAWVVGVVGMLLYTVISYIRLRRKIGTAVLLKDNIYQSESVVSPFVLGLIRPKIYLPFNMQSAHLEHVIAHENAHIRRKDHLWKPFGFLLLAVYWFNPLMWLGYILLCRDIELACDEKVIKEFSTVQKADYSEALLSCSVNRRIIAACPLAFGEVGVKNRVKTVLNYKKPAFWIIIVAIVTSIAVAVCFLTNPIKGNNDDNTDTPIISSQETGSDLQGVSLEIVNNGFHLPDPYIEVDWINEASDKILFGDEFNILYWQNGSWKSCRNDEEQYWNTIAYFIEPKKSGIKLYELVGFNFGKSGKYRFEAPFSIDGKPETEYTAWVEFTVTRDVNFAESFYFDPIELLYSDKQYTDVLPAEEASSYMISSERKLMSRDDLSLDSTLSTLESITLNEDTFDSRFRDSTNIISSIKKNNRRAWQIHGTTRYNKTFFYILLEQLDGSFYLGFGPTGYDVNSPKNADFSYFNAFYKVRHYIPRDLSSASSLSIASMTQLKELYPHFFDISTKGGLTVHIWQTSQNDYRCYLTNSSDKSFGKKQASYSGVTIKEMRAILSTYNVNRDKITLNPIKNSLSNYEYEINSKYKKNLEEFFWQDTNLLFATVTGACDSDDIKTDPINKQNVGILDKTHEPLYKFDTLKEFEDFAKSIEFYDPFIGANRSQFANVKEYFDNEFFNTHSLLIAWVYTSSGSSRVDAHSLEYTEDFLNIHVVKTKIGETTDVGYWFVTVAVPKELIKNCTEFDADFARANTTPQIEDLKSRLPSYFDLDTKNGLEVHFWVNESRDYYCGLLPTKECGYTEEERSALFKSPASVKEMRVILDYYIEKGLITKDKITIHFVKCPNPDWKDENNYYANSFYRNLWGESIYGSDGRFVNYTTDKNN